MASGGPEQCRPQHRMAGIGASVSFERVPAKDGYPPVSSHSPQLSQGQLRVTTG